MKKVKEKFKYNKKGITLISLAITIVVLLILTGISIATLTGDNGIIVNASKSKFISEIRDIQEQIELAEIKNNDGEDFQFGTLKNLIERVDEYNEILSIENGNLVYNSEKVNEKQIKWLEDMEIYSKQGIIPIYTKEQFSKIGSGENVEIDDCIYNFSLNAIYQLQNNINLECNEENQWIAIGDESNPFSGTLDGQNYTIYGIYISNDKINQGMFGIVSGIVKNIVITDSYVASNAGRAYIGNIAGQTTSTSQIVNCINQGKVESTNSVGGLIGKNHGLISNCINEGEIVGLNADVGGIVGENHGTITDCKNKGKISGGTGCRGGIAGINYFGKITKCINDGNLSEGYNSAGIVGVVSSGTIEDCYNKGITGHGGICMQNNINGIIRNCYNVQQNPGKNPWSAGIACENHGTITNCYNLGKAINGLLGYNTGTMKYCYYLSGTSTKMQIDISTGTTENCGEKTDIELKTIEFLNLLNTGNTESMYVEDKTNINNGYPILKWQQE